MSSSVLYERLILKNGGRLDFWVQEAERIKEFVQRLKITPVDRSHLVTDDPVPVGPRVAEKLPTTVVLPPRPFPGGLKAAHLHFNGDIYLLTDDQWKKFSAGALATLKEKLNKASTVSFEPLMELSEAINGLG